MDEPGSSSDLLAYALFELDPRAKSLQQPLQAFLISLVLFEIGRPAARAEIRDACEAQFLSGDKLDQSVVDKVVSDSIKAKLLAKSAGGEVELTEARRKQLQDAADRIAAEREQFHHTIRAAIEQETNESLSDADIAKLKGELEGYVQRLFQERSLSLADKFGPEGNGLDGDTAGMLKSKSLTAIARAIVPAGEKLMLAQVSNGIKLGLLTQSEEGQRYLAAIYQRTVASALLKQDPSVRKVRRDLVKQRVIYLDTNVVMALLFEAHPKHDRARVAVDAAQLLGCQLVVSPFTIDELKIQFEESNRHYAKLQAEGALLSIVADDILRTYAARRKNSPGLAWRAFYAEFFPPGDVLSEKGIETVQTDSATARHDELRPTVEDAVRQAKPPITHRSVVESDTDNLLLVQIRRKALHADEMGSRVWFVTLDRSLRNAEKVLVSDAAFRVPSSKRLWVWLNDLSPHLSPDDPDLGDYALHLVQSQLGLIAEDPIFADVDFLATLTESEFDLKELLQGDPNKARRVLVALQQDREVRSLLKAAPTEPAERERWASKVAEVVERTLATLDRSAEQEDALVRAETERDEARRSAKVLRRERDESRRRAARIAKVAERAPAEPESAPQTLWQRIFGRIPSWRGRTSKRS